MEEIIRRRDRSAGCQDLAMILGIGEGISENSRRTISRSGCCIDLSASPYLFWFEPTGGLGKAAMPQPGRFIGELVTTLGSHL